METIDIKSIPIKTNEWILDLGCGEGRHSIACDFHYPDANIVGVDINRESLSIAQNKHSSFIENDEKPTYVNASGFQLPFCNASFDHIICSEVLEHIQDYQLFLDEISRVLKPGGHFCLSVPRAWPERICWALSTEYYRVEGGHVRIFDSKQLAKHVRSNQFTYLRKHWAHALHSPYWWLRCLWWRGGNENPFSKAYHRILVWDLIKRPWLTQKIERLLNPVMGKSVVFYFQKTPD